MKKEWVRENCILVDVGTNFVEVPGQKQGVLCGDVEFCEETLQKVQMITPVPGGVGPMTVAMLMENVVKAWETKL